MPYFPVNLENQQGQTALVIAIANDNIDMVRILLNHGAAANATRKNWPLATAVMHNNIPMVELLVEYGGRVNEVINESLLTLAIHYRKKQKRNMDLIKCLVKHGLDPLPRLKHDPLDYAIGDEDAELVKYLIQRFHIMPSTKHFRAGAVTVLKLDEVIKKLDYKEIEKLISPRNDYFVLDVNARLGIRPGVAMIYTAIMKLPVLKLLERKGARVYCKDRNFRCFTPLMAAIINHSDLHHTVRYLCEQYPPMINCNVSADKLNTLLVYLHFTYDNKDFGLMSADWVNDGGHIRNLIEYLSFEPDLYYEAFGNNAIDIALARNNAVLYFWLDRKGVTQTAKSHKTRRMAAQRVAWFNENFKQDKQEWKRIEWFGELVDYATARRQKKTVGWSESLTNVVNYTWDSWNSFKGLFTSNRKIEDIQTALVEILAKIPKSAVEKTLEPFDDSDPEPEEDELSHWDESAYDSDVEHETQVVNVKSTRHMETNTDLSMRKLSEILEERSVKLPPIAAVVDDRSTQGQNLHFPRYDSGRSYKAEKQRRARDTNKDSDDEVNFPQMTSRMREEPTLGSLSYVDISESTHNLNTDPLLRQAQGFAGEIIVEGEGGEFTDKRIQVGETTFVDCRASCIGEGSDGTKVFSGVKTSKIDPDHPVQVAVKCLGSGRKSLVQREIRNLVKLRTHVNVITYLDAVSLQDNMYIILEHCNKSLDKLMTDLVKDNKQLPISPKHFLWQTTQGLIHLHNLKIVHRDLKPSNILLKECNGQHVVKLSDFHRSKLYEKEEASVSEGVKGTTGWRSPELYRIVKGSGGNVRNFITSATDVFSLGLVFYHVLSNGKFAQEGNTPTTREKNMYKNGLKLIGADVGDDSESPTILNLVNSLVEHRASDRVKAREIPLHPYFWDRFKKTRFIGMVNKLAREKTEVKTVLGEASKVVFDQLRCQNSWWNLFSQTVQDDIYVQLEKGRTTADESGNTYPEQELQDGSSLFALIRVMRNRLEHFYEHDYNIRAEMGGSPDSCLDFFCNKCPYLIPEVFQALRDMDIHTDDYIFFYRTGVIEPGI